MGGSLLWAMTWPLLLQFQQVIWRLPAGQFTAACWAIDTDIGLAAEVGTTCGDGGLIGGLSLLFAISAC